MNHEHTPTPAGRDAARRARADGASSARPARTFGRKRANRVFGPIVAGLIIDAVDLATFGPIGLIAGLPIGALAGFWLGSCLGLGRGASALCAVAAGVYCTIPMTELLPLGTAVGAISRYYDAAAED